MWLGNAMLICTLEEVKENALHSHEQIQGLEEKLRERTELNQEKEKIMR